MTGTLKAAPLIYSFTILDTNQGTRENPAACISKHLPYSKIEELLTLMREPFPIFLQK